MVNASVVERVDVLRRELNYHNHRYYVMDDPVVSDAEYDALMHRLEAIEHAFPELQGQDSPTQTVGGRAQTSLFDPVTHAERMLDHYHGRWNGDVSHVYDEESF